MQIKSEKLEVENTNELLDKEINSLKDKVTRLKGAYLNKIIDMEEYKGNTLHYWQNQ